MNHNNKVPAHSRFSLGHILACIAFGVLIGYRDVINYRVDVILNFFFLHLSCVSNYSVPVPFVLFSGFKIAFLKIKTEIKKK